MKVLSFSEMMKEPTKHELAAELKEESIRRETELKKKKVRTSKIIKDFGQWVVTTYGIECHYDFQYAIEKERLDENWLTHMLEKWWVFPDDFRKALNYARRYYKVKQTEFYD